MDDICQDRQVWWFYSEKDKKDWIPFPVIDRDRLEYAYINGHDKVAICAMDKQPFHLANLKDDLMTTLYWFDPLQYEIQRTDWIAIDIEYTNNSDTFVTSPAKFLGKERPLTRKWNSLLNSLATKNDENWLSFKLFDNENEISEKSIDLEAHSQGDSEIRNYNLVMRKGVPTVMSLINKSSINSTSKGKKKFVRLFRGYPAFYSQMMSLLLRPSEVASNSPLSSSNSFFFPFAFPFFSSASPSTLDKSPPFTPSPSIQSPSIQSQSQSHSQSHSINGHSLPSPFDPPTLSWQPAPKQIVYVVHGIGQKMACKWGYNFTRDVAGLRNLFYDHSDNVNDILLLPVSWRNILNLDPKREGIELANVNLLNNSLLLVPTLSINDTCNSSPIKPFSLLSPFNSSLVQSSSHSSFPVQSSSSLSMTLLPSQVVIEAETEFEKLLSSITIESVPTVRSLAGDATLDVMLYMLPEHNERIKKAAIQEILRLHEIFKRWHNPDEIDNVKISLIGHSLGAAIVTDIVSIPFNFQYSTGNENENGNGNGNGNDVHSHCQDQNSNSTRDENQNQNQNQNKDKNGNQNLNHDFKNVKSALGLPIDKIFTMGSPLALFLLIKHSNIVACKSKRFTHNQLSQLMNGLSIETGKRDYILDCNDFYNIFLPNDPVAYRIEPLVHHRFRKWRKEIEGIWMEIQRPREELLKPQMIPYSKGGFTALKMNIDEKIGAMRNRIHDWWNIEFESIQSWIWKRASLSFSHSLPLPLPLPSLMTESNLELMQEKNENESRNENENLNNSNSNENSNNLDLFDKSSLYWLNSNNRVDYVIREEIMENQYISAIKSHFRYWFDIDIAAFVIKELNKEYLNKQ